MLRFILVFILLIHGVIHVLGFLKEWQLASVEQLNGKTLLPLSPLISKAIGFLWLFTCGLFLVTAVLLLLKKEVWWMLAGVSVLLSQLLILLYWRDAKFGTLANLLIIIGVVLAYGTWNFNSMVKKELEAFKSVNPPEIQVVTERVLDPLPKPVQKWMAHSGVLGKEMIHTVHLRQRGVMRTSLEGNWMPVDAEQYFNITEPGFIWIADVKAAPLLHLYGRDKFVDGEGHMLIKLLSLYPVADSRGDAIAQGTMLRFLAESLWFPTFALSPYITWEAIDEGKVKATFTYGGKSVSGVFRFSNDGAVQSFEAKRYYDRKEGATLEDWLVEIDQNSFKVFDGFRIPVSAKITWKLKSGDFTWYDMDISDVVFNPE